MKTNSLTFGKQCTAAVMVVFKFVPKTSILKISNFWVLSFALKALLKFQLKCNSGSEHVPGAEGADIWQWCFILSPFPKCALWNKAALPGPGEVPMLERELTAGLRLKRLFRHHRCPLVWGKPSSQPPGAQLSFLKFPPVYGWTHPSQLSYIDPLFVLCRAVSTEGN